MQTPSVPDLIKAPAGEKLVLVAHATGFQIYVCRPDAEGNPAWTLKAPEAQLFFQANADQGNAGQGNADQEGSYIGKHFGGPTWQHKDGSEITGRMAAKVDAPEAGAIPWLLITVTDHSGSGVLSGITTIQRINTTGGLPPASGCTASSVGAESKSSYTADYYFYAKP